MDLNEAGKLMPVTLDFTAIVNAIKANTKISNLIGDRVTFMPPQKWKFPYVFFDVYSQTQLNSDDRQAVYFQCSCWWRLIAPSSWTRTQMDNLMAEILLTIQTFERTTIDARTVWNNVTAEIYRVEINKPVFFDDINEKWYKTLINDVDFEYK